MASLTDSSPLLAAESSTTVDSSPLLETSSNTKIGSKIKSVKNNYHALGKTLYDFHLIIMLVNMFGVLLSDI